MTYCVAAAVPSLYDAATLVGDTLREVVARDGPVLEQAKIDPGCSFIVGGQVAGEAPRLFLVYPQGNFIESTPDTPYFQIGETKHGKPILDRFVTPDLALDDAVKCLLLSFDETMRANLSVGPPIDLVAYEQDRLRITRRKRLAEGDEYFGDVSRSWSTSPRQAFVGIPDVSW